MRPKRDKSAFFILIPGILLVLNIFSWNVVRDLNKPRFLEVNFLNVGQGDAVFIESPKRQQILIDGGPDSAVLEKLAKKMPFWDRTIDLIILSHPEKDHLTGLLDVLKRYKVENILWTGVVRDTPEYKEWTELIKKEGAQIRIAKAGQKIELSSNPDNLIYFNIFNPNSDLSGQDFKDSNDTSIVADIVFNDVSFLFTGDISSALEKKLVLVGLPLESNVLKVSHHGSKYSTADYFLESVSPDIAVIEVGKNSYGHPTEEVLERLKNFGIKTLRTDLDGDIKITTNGKKYEISDF